jgi:hypothetical protein
MVLQRTGYEVELTACQIRAAMRRIGLMGSKARLNGSEAALALVTVELRNPRVDSWTLFCTSAVVACTLDFQQGASPRSTRTRIPRLGLFGLIFRLLRIG